ncbi:MAG: ferredoxin--NADP reductase [Pseudomonadota bacterium]
MATTGDAAAAATDAARAKALKGVEVVKVLSVRHWTDRLFDFAVERPPSFRFRSGEFAMIGLYDPAENNGKPLLRAYSIASPAWDEKLDFYSIKVEDGPLTSRLQHIKVGDEVVMRPKPVGTLVLDALLPGKRLFFFATGTGIAPFASLIREPEAYEKFDEVLLCHTCREVAELEYGRELVESLKDDPLVGEAAQGKLKYVPSATREPFQLQGRLTDLIESGKLFEVTGGGPLDPEQDRVMICGSAEMLADLKAICEKAGLQEGANNRPAAFVYEKSFVG